MAPPKASTKVEPEPKRPAQPDLDSALSKVCNDILKLSNDSATVLSLKRAEILNITTLINTTDQVLEYLTFMAPGVSTPQQISPGALVQVRGFVRWCEYLRVANGGILPEDNEISETDPGDFAAFMRGNATDPQGWLKPASQVTSTRATDPVADFKRSIKRDASLYPNLKDHRQWNNWRRAVLAQANAHDIQEVFDPNYIPLNMQEQALFQEKNRFAYAVLNKIVLTDEGKSYVRKYEKTFDAQSVYKELVAFANKSTAAQLSKDELMKYLTTVKLDSRWTDTTVSFILHWYEQMRLLDDMSENNEIFQDSVKKRMLESAVENIPELANIKDIDNNRIAIGGVAMDYSQYKSTLLSAATRRDQKLKPSSMINARSKRAVQLTEVDYGNDGQDRYDDGQESNYHDYYDFTSKNQTLIHRTAQDRTDQRDNNRIRLPFEIWSKLSDDVQNDIKEWNKSKALQFKPRSAQRTANVHDFIGFYPNDQDDNDAHVDNGERTDGLPDGEQQQDEQQGDEGNDSVDILAHITKQKPLPSTHNIRKILASAHTRNVANNHSQSQAQRGGNKPPDNTKNSVIIDGKRYIQADMHKLQYRVASHEHADAKISSLVDRGANGGLAGEDVRLIERSSRTADVSGINEHTIQGLPIATVAGVVNSHLGPICLIMHQYAYHGKGKTIHSSIQIEHHGNDVNDKSLKVKGGKQCITTLDGYAIPLHIRGGLAYMDMHPPDDDELNDLPQVVITSDMDWDPTMTDSDPDLEEWLDTMMVEDQLPGVNDYGDLTFDDQGYYRTNTTLDINNADFYDTFQEFSEIYEDNYFIDRIEAKYNVNPHEVSSNDPDFEALRPNFAWAPVEVIKRTFDITTRWARSIEHMPFRKHFKSRFPALNVHRRSEAVATDTVYSDTPAVDSGATSAQIFVGTKSLVTDVYGMKSDKEFVNTLQDNIRRRGAMEKLISDRAQVEISNKVLDILRNYIIDDWQSEPYHEHQNPAERRYQTIKTYTNKILDRTGAPAFTWLLALMYICYLFNHLACETLEWQTPLFVLTGVTTDISALLYFRFWEPVYFASASVLKYEGKPGFPSETGESRGYFVGFGESVGDVLTYKILTADTNKIIYRSYVRSALTDQERNRRLDPVGGEPKPILEFVKSPRSTEGEPSRTSMVYFKPDDIINRTYLTVPDENGQRFRAKIVQKIIDNGNVNNAIEQQPDNVKFLVSIEGGRADEIVAYNDILDYLEETMSDDPTEQVWNFKDIIAHEGPLKTTDESYKGSQYNVLVVWEDGSRTYEPLHIIGADCPVICADYAQRNGLLDSPGWKRFRNIAKNKKKMTRMINQAKLQSFRRAPTYQFGFKVPRTPQEAIAIDKENGNTRWQDSMALEMSQLQEYQTFTDLGENTKPPDGYTKIRVHFVFAVKHDGRHKARLVADGHLTDTPIDSVYSGVVSLRSLRIVVFLAELNKLELWGADIGNAYLEAKTKEKVYIIGGTGFGDLEGHTLVIYKALYGLKSSGARWHEKLVDSLRDLGFYQSKADSDVWMRQDTDVYEYIAVYTDDLAIASRDPNKIIQALEKDAHFKLKGVGPISYHLGCDYTRDADGTLSVGPRKYIEKMIGAYEQMFGEPPKNHSSPLERNDHPEVDESDELDAEGTVKYQSMAGALQWAVSLGRFDTLTSVMTMSRFRACPRVGHIERLKRIYGYLKKYKHGAIRIRTELPDLSDVPDVEHDWMYSIYGDVKELIPHDAPTPLGKEVVTITYEDANLYHDLLTGRAVTGVLHMINGTPIDWFSKRQDTVETATYGSEFVAARIAVEQIIDLRTTLRYLGVPIKGKAYMFGDNQSVITSSTIPHSQLSKRHNALSYHRVREAIVAKIINFVHIMGVNNPADILSKHCGFPQLWPHVQPLLFWHGPPGDSHGDDEKSLLEEKTKNSQSRGREATSTTQRGVTGSKQE